MPDSPEETQSDNEPATEAEVQAATQEAAVAIIETEVTAWQTLSEKMDLILARLPEPAQAQSESEPEPEADEPDEEPEVQQPKAERKAAPGSRRRRTIHLR
jgi:uncharacterized coiled-coil protein SlyX